MRRSWVRSPPRALIETSSSASSDRIDRSDGDDRYFSAVRRAERGFDPRPTTISPADEDRLKMAAPAHPLGVIPTEGQPSQLDIRIEWGEGLRATDTSSYGLGGPGSADATETTIHDRRVDLAFESVERLAFNDFAISDIDTSRVAPGEEIPVTIGVQEDGADGSFDEFTPDTTAEAVIGIVQGTIVSDGATVATRSDATQRVGLVMEQVRDEQAGGDPAGPARGIYLILPAIVA